VVEAQWDAGASDPSGLVEAWVFNDVARVDERTGEPGKAARRQLKGGSEVAAALWSIQQERLHDSACVAR
jgi:hypothetical protein